MSYILDALRKSETERHQGRVPDLAHSLQMVNKPRRKAVPMAAWVAAGFFVNALVLAVIFWPGTGFLASTVGGTSAEDGRSQAEDPVQPGASSSAIAPLEFENEPAASSVKTVVASGQSHDDSFVRRETPAGDRALPSQASSDAPPATPSPDRSATVERTTNAKPLADSPAATSAGQTASATRQSQEVGVDYVAGAGQQEQQAILIRPDRSRMSAPQGGRPEWLSGAEHLVEKSMAYQRRIPSLRFNSHIYASDPAARRVMINDHYLRVGDRFQGIRVEAINHEGVILSAHGETFRVGVVSDWVSPR